MLQSPRLRLSMWTQTGRRRTFEHTDGVAVGTSHWPLRLFRPSFSESTERSPVPGLWGLGPAAHATSHTSGRRTDCGHSTLAVSQNTAAGLLLSYALCLQAVPRTGEARPASVFSPNDSFGRGRGTGPHSSENAQLAQLRGLLMSRIFDRQAGWQPDGRHHLESGQRERACTACIDSGRAP